MITRFEKYRRSYDGCLVNSVRRFFESHPEMTKTRKQVEDEMRLNPEFMAQFRDWENSDYDKALAPTIVLKKGELRVLSFSRSGSPNAPRCVQAVDMLTGDVTEHLSIRAAAGHTGVKPANVSACCHGKQKTANSYKFKFI